MPVLAAEKLAIILLEMGVKDFFNILLSFTLREANFRMPLIIPAIFVMLPREVCAAQGNGYWSSRI